MRRGLALISLASVALALALACGGSPEVPHVDPTNGPTPLDPPVASPDPMDVAASREVPLGGGHCAPKEATWASCILEGGKVVSVCGPEDASRVVYRYGRPGAVELELAGTPVLAGQWDEGPVVAWFGSGERSRRWGVTFANAGHRYEVSQAITMLEDAELGGGLTVRDPDGRIVVSAGCEEDWSTDLDALTDRLAH